MPTANICGVAERKRRMRKKRALCQTKSPSLIVSLTRLSPRLSLSTEAEKEEGCGLTHTGTDGNRRTRANTQITLLYISIQQSLSGRRRLEFNGHSRTLGCLVQHRRNPQLCGSGVECEAVVKRGGGSSYRRSAGCFSTPRNTFVIAFKRETQLPPYPSPPALPRGPDSGIQSHDPIHPKSLCNHGTLLLPYLVMDVSLSLHLAPIRDSGFFINCLDCQGSIFE
ncbi:unnamed protein product [Arctogadus glacialis]